MTTTNNNIYLFNPATTLYLFDPDITLPRPKTWLLCRASTWPLPQLLDAAVTHYLDLNKRLPPVIRVHPKNLKATQEHFKTQKWSAIGIQTCGGVLACEVEIPYQQVGVG